MTVQTIIVGTDFSDPASAAMHHAIKLAKRHGARLRIVHAMSTRVPAGPAVDLQGQLDEKLASERAVAERDGVSADTVWREAPAWEAITEVAREENADLIVVGMRGHAHELWPDIRVGRTTDRVFRAAPCPVFAVPAPSKDMDLDGPAVVATDFSDMSRHAVDVALAVAKPDRPFVLAHVIEPIVFAEGYGVFATTVPYDQFEEEQVTEQLEALAAPIRETGREVKTVVLRGEPASILVDEARAVNASMLVLGTHGRRGLPRFFLGSVAERAAHAAPCPILVVRAASQGKECES